MGFFAGAFVEADGVAEVYDHFGSGDAALLSDMAFQPFPGGCFFIRVAVAFWQQGRQSAARGASAWLTARPRSGLYRGDAKDKVARNNQTFCNDAPLLFAGDRGWIMMRQM